LGVDFLLPASISVSTTLTFAMVFLLNYPEVQRKMQQELDDVVGRDRLPTLDDRARSVDALRYSKVKSGVFSAAICTAHV
jgi:cytochrome P450